MAQYYNERSNFLKANTVWAFGNRGGLDFFSGVPTPIISRSYFLEGGATASDPVTGKLLFYSDGQKCWNRNHKVMQNGALLYGNGSGNSGNIVQYTYYGSTSQGVCIVPMIDSPGKYYLFSLYGPADETIK